ncbi:MAG: SpoVA/SpoVAEb family sporulation membrane protein [Bacilli bacterium]|nr:SpoVA/SpoVAEb family sporulation membrane protein [Bacilli bacterium]
MEKKDYKKIVDKHKPYENRFFNAVIAFLVGGGIGIISQALTDFYFCMFNLSLKDSYGYMIITLIFFACLFTALGFFDKWVNFAKCGLIIPITGFAHSVMSAALEFKSEGLIYGVGSNIFKLAGSVIFYGIVSASIFGAVRFLLFGGV